MEPTPIFTDLAASEPARSGAPSGAHGEGRSVTDLLRALREEAPRDRVAVPRRGGRGVGHVPGLLTFPGPPTRD
ncbi:hypothetical protein [Actinomycetospora lemnae]|uniref:Uncharacterized protein n=1 Tax=Actinomycetospora lemnae TaxID=3019891 RepID=A0ABT5SPY3_9PSEU|nr:hypothetical protein [Actinomycetospora sp. DW7H6]MDD7964901.1 hypothetical protein [Actinomycetospora sp. DW7H6]